MMYPQVFTLAPMSALFRTITVLLFGILVWMLIWGPNSVGVIIAAIFAIVWFWFRPTKFAITAEHLQVRWPMRQKSVSRSDIESVEAISKGDFRAKYGLGVRIGAGGLWGGFGLLKTKRRTFEMYIATMDALVLIRMKIGRDLLISPDRPGEFVKALAKDSM